MLLALALALQTVSGTTPGGLAYEVSGAGAPVVLIHAFQMDRREWDEIAPALARSHRVVRYDARGHGRSAGPTAERFAAHDDLAELLRHLGIPRATLVGVSMGARIAVDFALTHPDHVDRLVLVGPGLSGYRLTRPLPWFGPIAEALRAGQAARAAELWWESPLFEHVPRRYREVVLDNARIWTYSAASERPLDPPAIGRLRELRVPVLIVMGANDPLETRPVVDSLVAAVPGARLEVMPDAGHQVEIERPDAFLTLLLGFLTA